ncbi:MAG TPA: hypothetical protein VF041_05305 [Gemmatimonadaceae bacterium]
MPQSESESSQAAPLVQGRRERLRFTDFQFRRATDGRCAAEVELEWMEGQKFRGTSSGQSSPTVDLRVAAEAALRAIELFAEGGLSFELIGVKAIRAFDATVVIVSVTNRREGPKRLLGAVLVEDDPVRGAVVAVLSATNRVLGNFIATR